MSTLRPPDDWRGRFVSTIDLLMFIREKMNEGMIPEIFIGSANVHALVAFTEGSSMALYHNGHPDQEFQDFIAWLRDIKREFPGDGWAKKYLRESGGDHVVAIRKFLDFVAEFVATRRG